MGSLVSAGNDNSWSIDHINSFTQVSLRTSRSQTGEMYKYRYEEQSTSLLSKLYWISISVFPGRLRTEDVWLSLLSLSQVWSGQNTNFASFLLLNNGNPWGVWLVGLKKVIDHLCFPFLNWRGEERRGSYMISRAQPGLAPVRAAASNIICNEPRSDHRLLEQSTFVLSLGAGGWGMPWERLPFCPSWLSMRMEVASLPNDSERSHELVGLKWPSV